MKAASASLALIFISGCAGMYGGGPGASATLQATRGSNVTGTVTLARHGDQLRLIAEVSGLRPNQEHGFHIHEKGDCSSGDGMSAGGHFNPFGKQHGHQSAGGRHAGDMPNLKADAGGNARIDTTLDIITLGDGAASVIGKAVIVHAQPDDYRSQPVGNAGARLACGVIRPT